MGDLPGASQCEALGVFPSGYQVDGSVGDVTLRAHAGVFDPRMRVSAFPDPFIVTKDSPAKGSVLRVLGKGPEHRF